jgi:hypothetical protein
MALSPPPQSDALCQECLNRLFSPRESTHLYIKWVGISRKACKLCNFILNQCAEPSEELTVTLRVPQRAPGKIFGCTFTHEGELAGITVPLPHRDLASKQIWKASMRRSTALAVTSGLAAHWLHECLQKHQGCALPLSEEEFLPSRLIEVYESSYLGGRIVARLRDKSNLSWPLYYTTLSHCWDQTMQFKLLASNIDQCRQEIPFEKLSKVFQDAMQMILQMGFSYIWIDSLCTL